MPKQTLGTTPHTKGTAIPPHPTTLYHLYSNPYSHPQKEKEIINLMTLTRENKNLSSQKSLQTIKSFAQKYANKTNTYFCIDPSITAVVIEGLARHKDQLGAPLCPCRHYEDKQAEVKATYWNCPCVPMRERKECHCMLFLTPDNDFAGEQQQITQEDLESARTNI